MPFDTPATSTPIVPSSAVAYPSPPRSYIQQKEEQQAPGARGARMTVTLEAVPDAASSSSRARRLRVPAHDVPVAGVREAKEVVKNFIATHRVGRRSFGPRCGVVAYDGKPACRIDHDGRIWKLDARGVPTGHEVGEDGEVVGFDHEAAGGGR